MITITKGKRYANLTHGPEVYEAVDELGEVDQHGLKITLCNFKDSEGTVYRFGITPEIEEVQE